MNPKPFDFQEKYRDPEVFRSDPEWRELMSRTTLRGVTIAILKSMSDDQIKETVVGDILAVTMYELQSGNKVKFEFEDLYRYLTGYDFGRARKAYQAISGHFVVANDRQPRIKPELLAEAMEYCGVYFTGYMPQTV